MNSYLHELDSDAVLLMYLADELPGEDRAEVEQLIADDPRLQESLERMKAAQGSVVAGLDRLDAAVPPPMSDVVARRQVGRMVRQWQVEQFARPSELPPPHRKVARWWVYPAAAAAVLLISFLVWWGNSESSPSVLARGERPAPTAAEAGGDPGPNGAGVADADVPAPRDLMPGEELALLERSLESSPDDLANSTVAVMGARPEDRVDAVGVDLLPSAGGTAGGAQGN